MGNFWTITLSVILVGLGVLAEVNLLRIFLGDWLRGRREHRTLKQGRVSAMLKNEARPVGAHQAKDHRSLIAAPLIGIAVCVAGNAKGAEIPAETPLSFQPGDPPAIPADPMPLTISPDRPGFSDGTGIAPTGHLQLETGYTFTFRNRDGVETQTHNAPELLARVGLIEDRLELRLGTSGYVWSRSNTGSAGEFESTAGFSDLYVGFKLKALDQDGFVPRLVFEGITTVGTGSRSVSNRDLEPTIKLIGSWDLGSGFSLTSNLGMTYATSGSQRFIQGIASASLSYSISDRLSVFGEYFVVGPHTKGTDAAHSLDFGGAFLLNNRIQLDARIGVGLNNQADNFFTGAGISFLF